ncbi:UDP-N-acetylmuramyl-tripeptide synthetase [Candidatus Parcubacteria bacterium]|nr:MAG: UDP-N-acetylmuramyl-tripeptide synthetase [Candidatus Parcubacteria bacterium]
MLKIFLKKLIPVRFLSLYHKLLALSAAFFYGFPSEKMIVVGITGTSGKSTVCEMLSAILEKTGAKVGVSSSIKFKSGKDEKINDLKMTMPGRFKLQRLLFNMVKSGCQFALIESTSEGIKQHRHLGINYDILIFTNLYPEHIESHGSFDNYKKAKGALFEKLSGGKVKTIDGRQVKKTIIANIDDPYAEYFLCFRAQAKYGYSHINNKKDPANLIVKAEDLRENISGISFKVGNVDFSLPILGRHNLYNALAAVTAALVLGIRIEDSKAVLEKIKSIPGRLEFINAGQPFNIIIDYAFLPEALEKVYDSIKQIKKNRIIHILGSAGGGRDASRRPKLGFVAGENADFVIVTNEDPYDEDPQEIINQVVKGAIGAGKVIDENLFKILDRRDAIKKALSLAKAGDLIIITGKGSEQSIASAGGKLIPWNDKQAVLEELGRSNH